MIQMNSSILILFCSTSGIPLQLGGDLGWSYSNNVGLWKWIRDVLHCCSHEFQLHNFKFHVRCRKLQLESINNILKIILAPNLARACACSTGMFLESADWRHIKLINVRMKVAVCWHDHCIIFTSLPNTVCWRHLSTCWRDHCVILCNHVIKWAVADECWRHHCVLQ